MGIGTYTKCTKLTSKLWVWGLKMFFKWAIPGLFFIYFRLFKQLYNFTDKCEKCPFSIWCWDSNLWPSEHESPPITTRPGLYCATCEINLAYSYMLQWQCSRAAKCQRRQKYSKLFDSLSSFYLFGITLPLSSSFSSRWSNFTTSASWWLKNNKAKKYFPYVASLKNLPKKTSSK